MNQESSLPSKKSCLAIALMVGAAFAIIAFFTVLISAAVVWSRYERVALLKNQYEMKEKDNHSEFDNMWKKIQQAAQVPEQKKEAFRTIFDSYAGSRSGNGGGQLATLVKEQVPSVDLSIYDKLMNIVTGSRDSWTARQKELVSIASEYNAVIAVQPWKSVLGWMGFERIEPKLITSERTERTFETGKDDDVSLFNK